MLFAGGKGLQHGADGSLFLISKKDPGVFDRYGRTHLSAVPEIYQPERILKYE